MWFVYISFMPQDKLMLKNPFEMKMVSPQINLLVVFLFQVSLGNWMWLLNYWEVKHQWQFACIFLQIDFLLRKVQWDLEKEIVKITVAGLFLKVLFYAPKL